MGLLQFGSYAHILVIFYCPIHVYSSASYLEVWVRDGDVVVLSFILSQQLKPAADWTSENLAHSERQSTHEVVPGRAVPVPDFHRQPPVPLVTTHRAGDQSQQPMTSSTYLSIHLFFFLFKISQLLTLNTRFFWLLHLDFGENVQNVQLDSQGETFIPDGIKC